MSKKKKKLNIHTDNKGNSLQASTQIKLRDMIAYKIYEILNRKGKRPGPED